MDSIKRLAQYLGHHGNVSLRRDMFGQSVATQKRQLSTGSYISAMKGDVVKDPIEMIKELFKDYDSKFWQDFKYQLEKTIEEKAIEEGDEVDITEVIPEDEWVADPFGDSDELFKELCDHDRVTIRGGITFGIEGITPPLVPDPDLVFTWELEFKAIDSFSKISISGTITFERVDDPGLGWIFAVIGFWLGGGAFFLSGIIGAGAGLAIGEILDVQYDNPQNQGEALKAINAGYDALEDYLEDFVESRIIQVSRPTERSFRITLEVDHVPSAARGLHGIACDIIDIGEWLS